MVTLVVIVSPLVSSGDDTSIDDACTGAGDTGTGMDILDDNNLVDGGVMVVQEWTLAMILVHAEALVVTLVVIVSLVVSSGDDTAIDYRIRRHWYRIEPF